MNNTLQASDAVERPTGGRRYALLDCWRGIACLMVIIHHSDEFAAVKYVEDNHPILDLAGQCVYGLRALGAGVTIFFVISGYCIAATVDSRGQRPKSTTQYFSRRFWRIYPPYWAMFLLMTLGVAATQVVSSSGLMRESLHNKQSPFMLTATQFLGNATLTETWRYHLFGSDRKLFMTHAWTLCYEEQFYLIVGLCLLLFPNRFFRSMIGVTFASLTLIAATALDLVDVSGFGFDRLWLPFAIGVLVYYRIGDARLTERRFIDVGIFSLAVVSTIANFLPWNWSEYSYLIVRSLAVASTFAVLLISLHRWDALLVARQPFKTLAFVGGFSYSLYLVHAPVVSVLARVLMKAGLKSDLQTLLGTIPICVAVSIPIAWGFFVLFERPFLHRKSSPKAVTPGETRATQFTIVES